MVDAVRQLTREQLKQFLRDHQAIRTFERMQQTALVDTPAMMVDFTAALNDAAVLASTVDARLSEAIAASNRLSEAIEALLAQPIIREAQIADEPAPAGITLQVADDCCLAPVSAAVPEIDDLSPPALPLTAGLLTGVLGSALGANPTATIGLTATNGTATTYIRSDGAPALSQAIAPTMTAQWRFSLSGNMATPTILMTASQPVLAWDVSDQAADEKRWGIRLNAKTMQFRSSTDNGSASIIWGTITRGTGTAITDIAFGDTTNNNTYSFASTGVATFGGQLVASSLRPVGGAVPSNGIYLPAANTVGLAANTTLTARYTSTTFEALLQLILSGDISPAQLTANTDDWNPTGLSTASVIRASTDASRNLTGIQGGADGRVLILINVGAQPLVLVHDSTSTAANRFLLASSTNTTVQANGACVLWYDSTSSRWRQITRVA